MRDKDENRRAEAGCPWGATSPRVPLPVRQSLSPDRDPCRIIVCHGLMLMHLSVPGIHPSHQAEMSGQRRARTLVLSGGGEDEPVPDTVASSDSAVF